MHAILTDDGREYEIRPREACTGILAGERYYDLWTRQQVAGRPWTRTTVSVIAGSSDEAEAEIAQRVIDARWPRHPEAIADEDYDRMIG